jgi:UDP-N-acetylglucosamine 1-carboxyvinyltransferase
VPPIQYLVEGGHRLAGNKNAALPIIAAALLTEHPVTLNNLPRIRDTENAGGADPLGRRCAEWRRKQYACDPRQDRSCRRGK